MDIQRLRNLTTGILHTDMSHVYLDIEYLVGIKGIMTHMIPNALKALKPYLMKKCTDPRFWDDKYDKDKTHIGEFDIEPMNETEQKEFWERYNKLPSPLEGKKVISVMKRLQDEI